MRPLLLLLTLAAGLLSAAEKYTVYESEHFELITDGSRGRAQEILAQFERVRSFFVKTMITRDPVLKPRIVVFQNANDYKDHAFNMNSAAYYISLPQRDYIAMRPETNASEKHTAVHEYVHLLVRYSDLPMPVWMNEGVAELYSNIEQIKKIVRVGTPIPHHVLLIRNDWIPLAEVVDADHESKYYNRRQHMGPFYGISWALVHMLVLDPRYKAGFTKLGNTLANGVAPPEAFQQTYGKSIQEVEADLKKYIRGNSVNVVNFEMQFDKVDEKVTGRPVTGYEWAVATADLLAGIRKHDQAAARLEAMTNTDKERPEAWESLAFLRMMRKEKGTEEAFDKALALGSTHPGLAYHAWSMTKDRKVAIESLSAAIAKYPAYSDARIRLAELQLYEREFQASFNTLKSIPKINRKQVNAYFPIFIQTAWYLGKLDESRGAAGQFSRLSATDQEKERSKRWTEFAMREPPKPHERQAEVITAQEINRQTEFRANSEDAPGEFGIDEDPATVRFRRNPLTYESGALVNLECKEPAVLHLKTETGVRRLLIDSPTALQVANAADGKGELTCGAQSRPVKMGFYPKEGLPDGATGVARSIEFLQ
ncbi:MAG: hypothetical protein HYX27_19520 [Acidobacteria bacterium]|nr:hypothetical protein [Acidobacteriota bacterium]